MTLRRSHQDGDLVQNDSGTQTTGTRHVSTGGGGGGTRACGAGARVPRRPAHRRSSGVHLPSWPRGNGPGPVAPAAEMTVSAGWTRAVKGWPWGRGWSARPSQLRAGGWHPQWPLTHRSMDTIPASPSHCALHMCASVSQGPLSSGHRSPCSGPTLPQHHLIVSYLHLQ